MGEQWQRIKDLFDAASILKPEERAAYLADACGGDDALRQEVESLLAADDQAGSFMTAPALPSLARPIFDDGAQVADRYRIVRFLGRGGMGEVYEAEDLRLEKRVALKTTRPSLAADPQALEQFKEEVRLAQKVTHRNVCRIFDLGVHRWPTRADGRPGGEVVFLTMELLDGETLRDYMHRRGPLPLADVLPLLRQLVDGLQAVHQAKVLHLDFKPGNVILVPAGGPGELWRAVITDFGIAQARAAEKGGRSYSPSDKPLMGAPDYMAPERRSGGPLTAAADVYALGVVTYKLITGRTPFKTDAQTPARGDARGKDPEPMSRYVTGVPGPWEALVKKMLDGDPARRYATMDAVAVELDRITQGRPPALWFLLALLLTLLVSGLVVFGRAFRPESPPIITSKDWVLVTDSENRTGDPAFDKLLDAALTISLDQSPHVNVFPRARLREALQRMRLDAKSVRVDESIGLEVCRREGLRAMLSGSIRRVGADYLLLVKIIDPVRGEPVKMIRVPVARPMEVFDKVDELARETRHSLGETLSSIQKTSKKLAEVTTSSLEALRLYTDALEQHNLRDNAKEAIRLYKDAIDQDPDFASAYRSLASAHDLMRDLGEARKAAQNALERKEKLTEREQWHVLALHERLSGRYDSVIQSYIRLTRLYPLDLTAHGNLGFVYNMLGRFDRSLEEYNQVLSIDPSSSLAYANYASAVVALGRYDEAVEYSEKAIKALEPKPITPSILFNLVSAYLAKGDAAKAREYADSLAASEDATLKVQGKEQQAIINLYAGQLAAAQRHLSEAVAVCDRDPKVPAPWKAHALRLQATLQEALGETSRPAAALDDVVHLSEKGTGYMDLLNLAVAAKLFARGHHRDKAVAALRRLEGLWGPEDGPYNRSLADLARGEIARQRGDYPAALAAFQRAAEYATRYSHLHVRESLAHTYFAMKDYDQAIREFDALIKQKGWTLDYWTGLPHVWITAHYWLGRSYEAKGIRDQAAFHYETFVRLWQNADTRVRWLDDARRRLTNLQ